MARTSAWLLIINMMLLKQAIQSQVGRRLFISFALASLLPIILLSIYAYIKVSNVLSHSEDQRMQFESKMIGLGILDNLNKQAAALVKLSKIPKADVSQSWLESAGFANYLPATEALETSLTSEERSQLSQGRVVLRTTHSDNSDLMMLVQATNTHQLFTAILKKQSWRNDDLWPDNFCLLLKNGKPIYCSLGTASLESAWHPPSFNGVTSGTFIVDVPKGKLLAGFWAVNLNAQFVMPGLIFVVAKQYQPTLALLLHFKIVFVALSLIALSISTWLALRQIRHQLSPLSRLMDGTRRLASGDFNQAIVQTSNDEFGQLAESFNTMSGSLSRKFHVLKKLDELDHAILNSIKPSALFRIFLDGIHPSLVSDLTLIINRLDDNQFQIDSIDASIALDQQDHKRHSACKLLFDNLQDTKTAAEGFYELRHDACLSPPLADAKQILAFPIISAGKVSGLLVLGFFQHQEISRDVIQSARLFSERLSVGLNKLEADQAMYFQAHHDSLTQLPNRILLEEHAERAIARSKRNGTVVALLLADLDGFKHINDSLGHTMGDQLLKLCAQLLQDNLRESDTVARQGGDEFILLLPDLDKATAADDALKVINHLSKIFKHPIELMGRSLLIEFSIGVSFYPQDAIHFGEMLKMADTAMYVAKRYPGKNYSFYSHEMNQEVRHRFELMQDLRTAISNNEMVLLYQPKIDAITGQIVGAEALARWQSPTRGLVSPNDFIPLLDQIGMSHAMGEWVIETVCAQMQYWDERNTPSIPVSLNLSPSQFLDESLHTKVQTALENHSIIASQLEIEILEDTAVDNAAVVQENLVTLREMGINIALDDFGTGYSSLVHLINVPATVLKLDRSFISDIATNTRQQAIVEHIISLAKTLDFQLVAEGVEDLAQAKWLKDKGCDLLQGYLYSRPVAAPDFERLLQNQQTPVL